MRHKEISQQRKERLWSGGAPAHVNDWRHLCKRYDGKCLGCHKQVGVDRLTRDHIIPIGMPGATNGISNLQPLCEKCNSRKGRTVVDLRPDRSSIVPGHHTAVWPAYRARVVKKEEKIKLSKHPDIDRLLDKKDEQIKNLQNRNARLGRDIAALNIKLAERKQECHMLRNRFPYGQYFAVRKAIRTALGIYYKPAKEDKCESATE